MLEPAIKPHGEIKEVLHDPQQRRPASPAESSKKPQLGSHDTIHLSPAAVRGGMDPPDVSSAVTAATTVAASTATTVAAATGGTAAAGGAAAGAGAGVVGGGKVAALIAVKALMCSIQ